MVHVENRRSIMVTAWFSLSNTHIDRDELQVGREHLLHVQKLKKLGYLIQSLTRSPPTCRALTTPTGLDILCCFFEGFVSLPNTLVRDCTEDSNSGLKRKFRSSVSASTYFVTLSVFEILPTYTEGYSKLVFTVVL
jgi:hypothetical protein